MTLKQKFFDIYTSYYKKSNELDKMVEVADDYAIEFAEWLRENYYDNGESWTEWNSYDNTHSSKELLEIFKKEKGL
jgi:hypothetical protein